MCQVLKTQSGHLVPLTESYSKKCFEALVLRQKGGHNSETETESEPVDDLSPIKIVSELEVKMLGGPPPARRRFEGFYVPLEYLKCRQLL